MAEDISRGIKISVEEFKAGLVKLSKINAEEALEHLDEALIYFKHHIIDGKIVQISDRNCLNVVQVVDEFLKSGKINIANLLKHKVTMYWRKSMEVSFLPIIFLL